MKLLSATCIASMQQNQLTIFGTRPSSSFFHMEPGATHVFGLDSKDVYNEDFLQNPRLRHHAAVFMLMFDRAVNLLGPDFDLLTEILVTLGERHYHMGVQIAYYPKMGLAMLQVLEMFLGNKFTPAVKASWVVTYQSLSVDMMRFSKRVLLN